MQLLQRCFVYIPDCLCEGGYFCPNAERNGGRQGSCAHIWKPCTCTVRIGGLQRYRVLWLRQVQHLTSGLRLSRHLQSSVSLERLRSEIHQSIQTAHCRLRPRRNHILPHRNCLLLETELTTDNNQGSPDAWSWPKSSLLHVISYLQHRATFKQFCNILMQGFSMAELNPPPLKVYV